MLSKGDSRTYHPWPAASIFLNHEQRPAGKWSINDWIRLTVRPCTGPDGGCLGCKWIRKVPEILLFVPKMEPFIYYLDRELNYLFCAIESASTHKNPLSYGRRLTCKTWAATVSQFCHHGSKQSETCSSHQYNLVENIWCGTPATEALDLDIFRLSWDDSFSSP